VGGSPVGHGASWSDAPRRLWLWAIQRTCDLLYLLYLGTKGSLMCLACPICAAFAVWLFYCAVFSRRHRCLCSGWGGDRLLPNWFFPVAR
jgi:hypothetical protein